MGSLKRCWVLGAALAAFLGAGLAPAAAASAAGSVGTNPADWTPQMVQPTGAGYVRQLVPCGPNMYAVGTFSKFKFPANAGKVLVRNNVLSFNATTGKSTAFNPNTNGIVNSIALDPSDCSTAWIGGSFTTVGGQAAKNIAAVDTKTGALRPAFRRSAGGQVNALLHKDGRLLVGGSFPSINGATRGKLASLDPVTGVPDTYLRLNLTGSYPGAENPTRAYNFTLSHSRDRMLVTGVFTAVNGVHREQVFQMRLGASSATLEPWTSPVFNTHCANSNPFWLQDATYSPDDSTVYTAATGGRARGDALHTGICDAVAAFPSTGGEVSSRWVNYTGCDTLFAVVADASSVYVTGHQRWLDNENGCDKAGVGSVSRPGLGAVDPVTGRATDWNPTRSRGAGADDLVLAFNGLWVASDNQYGATQCGGEYHPGICFLPY